MQAEAANPSHGLTIGDLDVLIVEDNAGMRLLLRTLLNAFGVKSISQASDGSEALAMIPGGGYDLVITDWEMTPMKGGDFLRELRSLDNKPFCFIPVIVLTGHASRKLVQQAFDNGATHLQVKPVTAASLHHRIEWVLADDRPYEVVGAGYRQPIPTPAAHTGVEAHAPDLEPLRESWTLD